VTGVGDFLFLPLGDGRKPTLALLVGAHLEQRFGFPSVSTAFRSRFGLTMNVEKLWNPNFPSCNVFQRDFPKFIDSPAGSIGSNARALEAINEHAHFSVDVFEKPGNYTNMSTLIFIYET